MALNFYGIPAHQIDGPVLYFKLSLEIPSQPVLSGLSLLVGRGRSVGYNYKAKGIASGFSSILYSPSGECGCARSRLYTLFEGT